MSDGPLKGSFVLFLQLISNKGNFSLKETNVNQRGLFLTEKEKLINKAGKNGMK